MQRDMMKAVTFNQYGDVDVLQIADVPKPQLQPNTVLVRVHASAVNPKDTFIRKGRFKRFTGDNFPQLVGFDFAGEVVESSLENFTIGTRVFGMLEGWHGGTCAEYILVQANQLAHLPDTVSWVDAASVPLVSLTALQALRDNAKIQSGMRFCINGASGGVGSMAVQIAKVYGCHITAIASESNHDFLSDLGADICLDYRQTDIRNSDQHFDIFFDVFGNTHFRDIKPILSRNGTWVSTVIKQHVFASIALSKLSSKSAELVVVKAVPEDLSQIAEWMVDGQLRAVIHQTYTMAEIAEAHQQQQSKHTCGKLVITL